MERLLILIALLCVGCTTDFKRVHFAVGATSPFARNIQPVGQSITYAELSYKNGHTASLCDKLAVDGMYGPRLGIPLTDQENGVILGLETELRLRLVRDGTQPYLGFHAGTAYFTERWPEQGTDWGFTLGPLFGFKWDNFFVEYKFWHESNGTKAFGHDKGPNPGFNASLISIGLEW